MPHDISLRPISDGDREFLAALYAGTREEEMKLAPWSNEQKERFLQQQFDAQHQYYQMHFAGAHFDLICRGHEPIGRLYVSRVPEEIRVIDIALLPEHRGQGLGTRLMESILQEAKATRRPVRIHVESFNPARRLYERLGFRKVEDRGVYLFMEWTV